MVWEVAQLANGQVKLKCVQAAAEAEIRCSAAVQADRETEFPQLDSVVVSIVVRAVALLRWAALPRRSSPSPRHLRPSPPRISCHPCLPTYPTHIGADRSFQLLQVGGFMERLSRCGDHVGDRVARSGLAPRRSCTKAPRNAGFCLLFVAPLGLTQKALRRI